MNRADLKTGGPSLPWPTERVSVKRRARKKAPRLPVRYRGCLAGTVDTKG
jgi:hypothetical protein